MHLKDFTVDRAEEGKDAALCGLMCKTGRTECFVSVRSGSAVSSYDLSRKTEMLIQSQSYYSGAKWKLETNTQPRVAPLQGQLNTCTAKLWLHFWVVIA